MQDETTQTPGTPQGFPVDLTEEEFLAYHMLSARVAGPLRGRTVQLVLSVVLCALLIGAVVYGYYAFGEMDWFTLIAAVALGALAVIMWTVIPVRMRKQAHRLYQQTVDSGYSYYGMVEVRPTEIVKVGQETTTAIPFNGNALFIENGEMQVFISRQGRAIVLPARCMTPETAAMVRAAADRLPSPNRRFIARLQPGCQPVEEPAPVETVILWEQTVRYTPEEYAALAKSRLVSQFWRRLPHLTGLSLMLAVLFSWGEETILPAVLTFLTVMGIQVLFGLILPYRRIPRQPVDLPASLTTVEVTFTDRGVKLRSGEQFASLPWSAVEHVYDRGDYAELLYQNQSLRIPKRLITDLDAFDRLLKQYWRNNP